MNRVVIVVMTAKVMAEDRENCFAIGMDDFITKPAQMEHLAEILTKHKNQKAVTHAERVSQLFGFYTYPRKGNL